MADFSISAKIKADTSDFEKGINNVQKSTQKLSKSFQGLEKTVSKVMTLTGIGLATKAMVGFGKSCSQAANQATKQFNILDNTVQATGADAWTSTKELDGMAKSLSNSTNYSVGEIEKMQSVLLGFRNITTETFEDASEAVMDMATVMGMDLTSAVQTVGKALDDPIKGLDSLRRQGFAFTDEQKSELEILVKTGKQVEAQKIILDELASSYGGAAKAGQDAFAQQRHSLEKFTETVGNKLLPITQVIAKSNAKLLNNISSFVEKLDISQVVGFFEQTQELFSDFGKELGNAFSEIDEDAIYNALNFVYKTLQIVVKSISAIIHGDWNVVWDYAKLAVLGLVNSVAKALDEMTDEMKVKLQTMLGITNVVIAALGIALGPVGVAVSSGIALALQGLETYALHSTTAAKNIAESTAKEIEEINNELEKKTKENSNRTANYVIEDLDKVDKKSKEVANNTKKNTIANEKSITKETSSFTKGIIKSLNEIGKDYISLGNKIERLNKLFENTGYIIANEVVTSFKSFFTTLGEELVNGGVSWKNMTAIVLESISQTLSALGSELTALAAVSLVTKQYGDAAVAAAGAAAAFTASGVVAGIANKMEDVTKATSAANMSLKQFYKNLEELSNVSSLDEYASSLGKIKKHYTEISDALQNTSDMIKGVEVARKISAAQFAAENYKYDWYRKENYKNLDYSSYYDSTIQGKLNKAYKESLKLLDDLSESERAVAEYWIEHNSRLNKSGSNLKDYYKSLVKLGQQYIQELTAIQDKLNTFNADTIATLKAQQEELEYSAFIYDYIYSQISSWGEGIDFKSQYSVLYNQLLVNIKNVGLNLKKELLNIGTSVGDSLIDGIIDGAEKTDFLSSLKSVVRENVLKLAVYTESMQEELANASTELISAISMGDSVLLSRARTNFESIWDSAKQAATDAENFINEVFGDIQDGIEDVTDEIKEMGSSISESLVSGLTEGLTEADFMETMKNYIKGMVVNAVVYTEALQAEIASIGEAISKGIQEGFTDTGLHEIRRDLSYIFNQANNAVSSIDSVLSSVFTGYATGTDNATAGLHLVGEAGPELVRFRGGEQVFNANETKDILNGAGGNNFNVTFNNMQDTSAYAMLQQMKQWQREIAINGII